VRFLLARLGAARFLMRFFETRTLMPFAVYCFAAGLLCSLWFLVT
jgi:undecaprenyl-diphosphatase